MWGRFLSHTSLGAIAGTYAFARINAAAFVSNVLLVHSMGVLHSLSFNYPSWSISTEYYAYVLFAAVCIWLGCGGRLMFAAVAIVVGSVALLAHLGVANLVEATSSWGFIRCITGFFLGVLVWGFYSGSTRRSLSPRVWAVVLPLALVATGLFLAIADTAGWASYLFPLLSSLIILAVVCSPVTAIHRTLASVPLRWLGKISYSVYMTHAAVQWVISQVLETQFHRPNVLFAGERIFVMSTATGTALLVVYVGVVLALSHITFTLIEEPCRLRSRQFASRI
jgi:peptidoglycan/LPS O-acetylase OafA/YrhL